MEESRGERVVQSGNEERVTNDDSTSSPSDESSTASQDYHPGVYDDCETKRRKIWTLAEAPPIARDDFQFIGRSKNNRIGSGGGGGGGGVGVVENLSRRNEPSNLNQLREFQEFHEFHEFHGRETSQLTIGKSREYDFASVRRIDDDPLNGRATCDGDVTCDGESSKLVCRTRETTTAMSEPAFFNLVATRKYLSGNFERCPKELNYLVERETKDYGLTKGYSMSLDRTKEYGVSNERQIRDDPTILPCRKRPYGAIGINDDERGHHEANYDQRDDIDGNLRIHRQRESIVYERIKRPRNPHEREFLGHGLIQQNLGQTCATQIQPQLQQEQQEHQQQKQIKSFTIDAILAHRNQRERHQKNQQAQQKKSAKRTRHHHECEEITLKVSGTSVNETAIGSAVSGKAKRVRTIFTVEQLERLESEFARQQYMVGPERLYLAHALRLTEAQVKVWFQNRRIKWRKVNQEQHRQAVSEHRQRQRCSLPVGELDVNDDEESNETINWCVNNSITAASSIDDNHVPLMIGNCEQRDIDPRRGSLIVKV